MSEKKFITENTTVNPIVDDKSAQVPPWMKEVAQRRRSKESVEDVRKKWDEHIRTGGDGSVPWIQEIAKKKKEGIDKQKEEVETTQWIAELKQKKSTLIKRFDTNDD